MRLHHHRQSSLALALERRAEEPTHHIENLLAGAQALSARFAVLNDVAIAFQSQLELNAVLQTIADQARWLLDFDYCTVALRRNECYQLLRISSDSAPKVIGAFPLEYGVIGDTFAHGSEQILQTVPFDQTIPSGMQSGLIVPLRHQYTILGVICFFSQKQNLYSYADVRVVSALSLHISLALHNTQLFSTLKQSESFLAQLFDTIHDACLVIDENSSVLMLNEAMRDLIGLPSKEFAGKSLLHLLRHSYRLYDLVSTQSLRNLFHTWHSIKQDRTGLVYLKDGRCIEWSYTHLRTPQGATMVSFRDVSDRMERENLRVDLVHALVHDLRTPLTSLSLGLRVLQFDFQDRLVEKDNETLLQLEYSINQLTEHVRTILDVNQIEVGKLQPEYALSDMSVVLYEAIGPLLPIFRHSGQVFESAIPGDLPLMAIDQVLVRRVIINLLSNACKFTPEGGCITLGAKYDHLQNWLEIWVQDTGLGVTEEFQSKIFDKYVQASQIQRRNGSGLGLFFCRLVVEAHGGSIGVQSSSQTGSRFWFRLPVRPS
jgi:PAS domain S-box-containing protein